MGAYARCKRRSDAVHLCQSVVDLAVIDHAQGMNNAPPSLEALVADGRISPAIYTDEAIYQAELKNLFGRAWLFIAHESQISQPGDFVTSFMGEDPIVVTRQADGSIGAFLNQCRHRGMKLCRLDSGSARRFTCSYHGWVYDTAGKLVGVPREAAVYGESVDRGEWSAVPVAQLDSYKGLVFATWDAEAPALGIYLGAVRWYLDAIIDRVPEGSVVFGGAHRWTIETNWKLPAEQFASDFYHAHTAHRSAMAALAPPGTPSELLAFPDEGFQFSSAQGHGTGFAATELPLIEAARRADPAEVARFAAASERLGDRRGESMGAQHMTVFPNLSLLKDPRALRIWHPRGPNSIEVWSWTLVDGDLDDERRRHEARKTMTSFSPAGIFEADDGENWVEIQGVLRGAKARETELHVGMGLERDRPANPGFPGDIDAAHSEEAARRFYARWAEMVDGVAWGEMEFS